MKQSVDAQIKRGSAEVAILSVLAKGALHGYEIAKRIEQQTEGVLRFDIASLYPMLYRMEKQAWIKGEWEVLRNGRRRRCYRLTAKGRSKLVPLWQQWRMFFQALHRLAEPDNA